MSLTYVLGDKRKQKAGLNRRRFTLMTMVNFVNSDVV